MIPAYFSRAQAIDKIVHLVYNNYGDYMNKSQKIINLYFSSIKKFNEIESQPRDFGTGDLLYSSEIHTLEAIGKYPGSNLTELSEKLNITKGGTSKFVKKLLAKDLIVKESLADNKKETFYRLTSKGEVAYKGHQEFSLARFGDILQRLSELSLKEANVIEEFLEDLNEIINRH